jgi:hypothetical protein
MTKSLLKSEASLQTLLSRSLVGHASSLVQKALLLPDTASGCPLSWFNTKVLCTHPQILEVWTLYAQNVSVSPGFLPKSNLLAVLDYK